MIDLTNVQHQAASSILKDSLSAKTSHGTKYLFTAIAPVPKLREDDTFARTPTVNSQHKGFFAKTIIIDMSAKCTPDSPPPTQLYASPAKEITKTKLKVYSIFKDTEMQNHDCYLKASR
tara:strand:+ start:128 stop:484 length:357 start_codon:yes stop_codon:yes gene_type:complete